MFNTRSSPRSGAFQDNGDTANVLTPPAWVTVTDCPASVTVPVRACTLGFAAAVSVTAPDPVPPVALTVSHAASDAAVHGASLSEALTPTLRVPPPTATAQLVGLTVKVLTPPACVTVTVWPATVTVAVRGCTLALAAAVSVTAPEPSPLAGVTVTQGAEDVAVQGASLSVASTVRGPRVPPAADGAHDAGSEVVKVFTPAA